MSESKPLRLFFIRHGQTENHENPPFNGWRDAPLTEEGRRQLDAVAESLGGIGFDAVYSSDLSRAVYGGSRLAEKAGLPLISDARWREMNFGRWEGLNYGQIAADDKELIGKIFSADGDDVAFPGGGESSNSFGRRIEDALADLWSRHPQGGRVAVVAHGGVCKALWAILLKIPPHIAWTTIHQDFAAVNMADCYPSGINIAHLINAYVGPEGYHSPGTGLDRLIGEKIFNY